MQREGVVNAPILPVYARRDILQIRTDELLYGTKVNIIDTKERDRYWIETDYHYTGLVSSKSPRSLDLRLQLLLMSATDTLQALTFFATAEALTV